MGFDNMVKRFYVHNLGLKFLLRSDHFVPFDFGPFDFAPFDFAQDAKKERFPAPMYKPSVSIPGYDPQAMQPSGLSNEQDICSTASSLSAIVFFIISVSTVNFTASVAALVLR